MRFTAKIDEVTDKWSDIEDIEIKQYDEKLVNKLASLLLSSLSLELNYVFDELKKNNINVNIATIEHQLNIAYLENGKEVTEEIKDRVINLAKEYLSVLEHYGYIVNKIN